MEIKTIVVLGNLNQKINLASLSILDNYRLSKSQGYLKLGTLTASIYKTGKVQIYGIKNESDIPDVWSDFLNKISPVIDIAGVDSLPALKFMLAMEKMPFTIDLSKLKSRFSEENIEYEPEQFPGLVWRLEKGTALIFSSGSVTLTGYNDRKLMERDFAQLQEKIKKGFNH